MNQARIPSFPSLQQRNFTARWLALAGVVGPIVFVGAFTLAGFLRPGYSPIHQAISDLGVGTNAWLLDIDCVVFGVLLLAFAIGFFLGMCQVLADGWRLTCLILLILSGMGAINAGIFTEAPATVTVHWTLGFQLAVLPPVVVCGIVGWQWLRVSGWHGYGWYSLIAALVTLVLVAVEFWCSWSLPGMWSWMATVRLGRIASARRRAARVPGGA